MYIEYYETTAGKKTVKEFIDFLESQDCKEMIPDPAKIVCKIAVL